jgi:hypothetical protein
LSRLLLLSLGVCLISISRIRAIITIVTSCVTFLTYYWFVVWILFCIDVIATVMNWIIACLICLNVISISVKITSILYGIVVGTESTIIVSVVDVISGTKFSLLIIHWIVLCLWGKRGLLVCCCMVLWLLMLCMELIELDLIVFAHGKGVKHKYLDYHLI